MANIKITDLTAYTDAASTDVLPIVDVGADVTKKITIGNVVKAVPLGTAELPGLAFDGDPNTGIYSPGADQVVISTNGTGRLFISDDGKVGIGVSDPSSYNISADDLVIASPGGGNTGIQINITDNSGSSNIWFGDSDGEGRGQITYAHGASDSMGFWVGGAQNLALYATGALAHVGGGSTISPAVSFNGSAPVNSLVIDSSGRVGLGTSSPSDPLTVLGNTSGTMCTIQGSNTTSGYGLFVRAGGSDSGRYVATFQDAASNTRLHILSNGNVGIGTTSPAEKLEINGDLLVSSGTDATLYLGKGAEGADGHTKIKAVQTGADTDQLGLAFFVHPSTSGSVNSQEAVRIDSSGTFRVKGAGTAGVTDAVQLNGSAPANSLLLDASGRVLVGTSTAFETGTDSIVQGLQTSGARIALGRNDTTVSIDNTIGQLNFYGNATSGTYSQIGQIKCTADGTHTGTSRPTRLEFSTTADSESSPTPRMTIKSDGKVGISTTSPESKLHVRESTVSGKTTVLTLEAAGTVADDGPAIDFIPNGSVTASASIVGARPDGSGVDGYLGFYTNNATTNSERMRIDSSGNVGIGTTSVSSNLHIKPSGDSTFTSGLRVERNDTSGQYGLFSYAGGAASITAVETTASNPVIRFQRSTNGSTTTESARIDSSGRLLVGTSSSSSSATVESKLQVEGTDASASLAMKRHTASNAPPYLVLAKSRGGAGNVDIVQNGDRLGEIFFAGADGVDLNSQGASIKAEVDGTPGTNDMPGRLVFSTTADSASSPTEQMRISSNGTFYAGINRGALNTTNFGTRIGATTNGTLTPGIVLTYRNTDDAGSVLEAGGSLGYAVIKGDGDLENTNNSYAGLSDVKLKENIVDANSQWSDLKALQVRNYNFKAETGYNTHTQIGLIAQEVELVSPGLVGESIDEDTGESTKSVNYSVLYMKAVKALQEAMERIEQLEAKVAALEGN